MSKKIWVIPYVDHSLLFWEQLYNDYSDSVKEVYFPLPVKEIGSGRPLQPQNNLDVFLKHSIFPISALINPIILPQPVEDIAPKVIEALRNIDDEFGLAGVTVSNLLLASRIREKLPDLPLVASTLMNISHSNQATMIQGIFDGLVPATSILRDIPKLTVLRSAFGKRIRLIVNEACLPGCPFRTQHFYEMGSGSAFPKSLCNKLLERLPWMRLTSGWVLPQHLNFYDGLYDELKLSGRVTLRDPTQYRRILDAYINRTSLQPSEIGGGPASVLESIHISAGFFAYTLKCGRYCHKCSFCQDYYEEAMKRQGTAGGKR